MDMEFRDITAAWQLIFEALKYNGLDLIKEGECDGTNMVDDLESMADEMASFIDAYNRKVKELNDDYDFEINEIDYEYSLPDFDVLRGDVKPKDSEARVYLIPTELHPDDFNYHARIYQLRELMFLVSENEYTAEMQLENAYNTMLARVKREQEPRELEKAKSKCKADLDYNNIKERSE